MQPTFKTSFLSLACVRFTAVAGMLLTACSTPSQNQSQAPNSTTTNTGSMQGSDHSSMDHGSMAHGMAMDLGPADANYDLRFIDAMRLHHQGAVTMAQAAQQKSQRSDIKTLADTIVMTQSREDTELLQRRKAWYPQASSELVAYGGASKSITPMSESQRQSMRMEQSLGTADAEFDLRFINAMIPHHKGALTMAQDALNKSKRPEIKQLAQAILTSQRKEIEQMQRWRQAWYQQ